jgi:hypothetical protein
MNTFFRDGIEYETIGGIDIPLPPRPPKKEIANYNLPKEKQKFYPTQIPDSFRRLARDEFGNPIYTAEQNAFIEQELKRILNGFWFYNFGKVTYITGYHYAELVYWKIDVGLKEYRDRDRRVHLHWDYCEKDPNCYGQIYMKHRRDGATHRTNAINYFRTIRFKGVHSGIQSKTGKDAGKVFKKLITAWRKLPFFLQPIHEGTTFPKQSLNFFEPPERVGKNNRRVKESEALESWIDFETTQAEAYDGEKLCFYHMDEAGKTVEEDVSETWKIAKECLSLGNKIVGKCAITSTVSEIEKKGGKNFKKIYEQSNPNERDPNGRTVSGLYRLFIPADDGLEGFIDEYGYSLINEARQYLLNKREGLKAKGDSVGLAKEKQLYPLNEKEALAPDGAKCLFDSEKINNRLDELTYLKVPIRVGNFVWENNKRDTRVVFVDDPNGRFKVCWLPEKPEETNKVLKIGERYDITETGEKYLRNLYKPDNHKKFTCATDPVDHNTVVSGAGSKAAAYVFRKHNILELDDPYINCFVVQYLARPKMAKIFYEDIIKVCVFFGCEMLYETQKPGIKTYFEDRGYGSFLMIKPKVLETKRDTNKVSNHENVGGASSPGAKQQIAEHIEEYIYTTSCKNVCFTELLEDWLEFDIADTEKYDAAMASGWTLIASTKLIKEKPKEINITSVIPTYNNAGASSELNYN